MAALALPPSAGGPQQSAAEPGETGGRGDITDGGVDAACPTGAADELREPQLSGQLERQMLAEQPAEPVAAESEP